VLIVYSLCAPVLLLFRNRSARLLIITGTVIFSFSLFFAWDLGTYMNNAIIRSVWSDSPTGNIIVAMAGLLIVCDYFSRALGMMMLGMGLYRSGWLLRTSDAHGLRKSIVLLVGSAVVAATGVYWTVHQQFDAADIVLGNIPNSVATIPMVFGYLGILMWWDQHSQGKWLERVRALGRMALTNYLSQTVICVLLFHYIPKEWVSRSSIWLVVISLWVIRLYASEMWLRKFRMGPLEWLWRCATYREISSILRKS